MKAEEIKFAYPNLYEVATELGISRDTLRNHILKCGLMDKLIVFGRSIKIPPDIAERILGYRSNPPHTIDNIEYAYSLGRAARMIGVSRKGLHNILLRSELYKCCYRDGRIIRIPRSVVMKIQELCEQKRKTLKGR